MGGFEDILYRQLLKRRRSIFYKSPTNTPMTKINAIQSQHQLDLIENLNYTK